MRHRLPLALALLLVPGACTDRLPLEPPQVGAEHHLASSATAVGLASSASASSDLATMTRADAGAAAVFLPPLGPGGASAAKPDVTLLSALRVRVCRLGAGSACDAMVAELRSGNAPDGLTRNGDSYMVHWRAGAAGAYRVLVDVHGLSVGAIDLLVGGKGGLQPKQAIVIRFSVEDHPLLRARVLAAGGASALSVAASLVAGYGATDVQVADILQQCGYASGAVVSALRATFDATSLRAAELLVALGFTNDPERTLALLVGAGWPLQESVTSVLRFFPMGAGAVAGLLQQSGYPVQSIANVLRITFEGGAAEVGAILRVLGYPAGVVAVALKAEFERAAEELAADLVAAGFPVTGIADALLDAFALDGPGLLSAVLGGGVPDDLAASSVAAALGLDVGATAALLREAGWTADRTAVALGRGPADTARALREGGYSAAAALAALQSTLGTSMGDAARHVRDAGYDLIHVVQALQEGGGHSAASLAAVLQAIGVGAAQAAAALLEIQTPVAQLVGILSGAGFGDGPIVSALSTVVPGLSPEGIAELLRLGGWDAARTLDAMGVQLADVATRLLKAGGYPIESAVLQLLHRYALSPELALRQLMSAAYALDKVAGALSHIYQISPGALASLLRESGVDPASAAQALLTGLEADAGAVAQALLSGGFSLESVVRAVDVAANGTGSLAYAVHLMGQLGANAPAMFSVLLGAYGAPAVEAARAIAATPLLSLGALTQAMMAFMPIREVIGVAGSIGVSYNAVAGILMNELGVEVGLVAEALRQAVPTMSLIEVASIIDGHLRDPVVIATQVIQAFGLTPANGDVLAGVLHQLGYSPVVAAGVLRTYAELGADPTYVAAWLQQGQYGAQGALEGVRAAFSALPNSMLAAILQSTLGVADPTEAARILTTIGLSVAEVEQLLADVWGAVTSEIDRVLCAVFGICTT